MSSAIAHRIVLTAHPSTPSDAIHGLEVQVHATETRVLTFGYTLQADLSGVLVPSGDVQGRADGLWKHTCFEAFFKPGDSSEYYELNFSPARQWAVYHFDAYREGMSPAQLADSPEISVRRSQQRLELDAVVRLPPPKAGEAHRPRLALAAVLEEENGRLCYWAARHPAGRPDFHHPDGFAFELFRP